MSTQYSQPFDHHFASCHAMYYCILDYVPVYDRTVMEEMDGPQRSCYRSVLPPIDSPMS